MTTQTLLAIAASCFALMLACTAPKAQPLSAPATIATSTAAPRTATPTQAATIASTPTPTAIVTQAPPPASTRIATRAATSAPLQTTVFYQNCTAARAAGAAPLYRGDPGYRAALDRDNDGVACE